MAAALSAPTEGPVIESYEALLRRVAFGEHRDAGPTAPEPTAPRLSTEAAERHAYHRLLLEQQSRGVPRDEEHIDLEIARRMSREGISVEQIALAIESGSPDLARRHEDTQIYALKTVRASEGAPKGAPSRLHEPDR